MATRHEITTEARAWIGTRFEHQAALKGVSCDCIGLMRGVGIECGIFPRDYLALPWVREFIGYGRQPIDGQMMRACRLFMQQVEDLASARVVLMKFGAEPHHIGLIGDYPLGGFSVIHAYAPMRKVVEHRLDDIWRSRIVAIFEMPGVTE